MTIDEATPTAEIWPDNLAAVNVFIAMDTQWRTGYSGATGLDYNALPAVLRLTGVARKAWPGIFNDLRILEDAALTLMRAK